MGAACSSVGRDEKRQDSENLGAEMEQPETSANPVRIIYEYKWHVQKGDLSSYSLWVSLLHISFVRLIYNQANIVISSQLYYV